MRRSLHGGFLAVFLPAAAACVEIPANIHAEFAPAGPNDRSNYRAGQHGSAPPAEQPDASANASGADAGTPTDAPPAAPADGGVT